MINKNEILNIIETISAIVSEKGYDGALDEDGEVVKFGLQREVDNFVLDSRSLDGFKVKFSGKNMYVTYHTELKLEDVYAKKIEQELEDMIEKVVSFIKKEYRSRTGSSLSLKSSEEMKARIENTSRVRVFAVACKIYEIGGMEVDPIAGESRDSIEKSFSDFVSKGGWKKTTKKSEGNFAK